MKLETEKLESLVAAIEAFSDQDTENGSTETGILELSSFTEEEVDSAIRVLNTVIQTLMAVGSLHQMKKLEKLGQYLSKMEKVGNPRTRFDNPSNAEFDRGVQAVTRFPERWTPDMSRYLEGEPARLTILDPSVIDGTVGQVVHFGNSSGPGVGGVNLGLPALPDSLPGETPSHQAPETETGTGE